ncbi:MAG: hypothetical protein LQ340_004561, partial [Diploschistes diacapsis]
MALVGYSDSEGSGNDQSKPTTQPSSKAAPTNCSQRLIDRSNPHVIRINLPKASAPKPLEGERDGERPAKRAKTVVSSGGFNAMLPAPKRSGAGAKGAAGGASKGRGLGNGVSLKTSAQVGFSREPIAESETSADEEHVHDDMEKEGAEASLPVAATDIVDILETPKEEPKKVGNPMMFKPLSVARKPRKKKASNAAATTTVVAGTNITQAAPKTAAEPPPPSKPKISLFSTPPIDDIPAKAPAPKGDYQPLIHTTTSTTTTTALPAPDTEDTEDSSPPIAAPPLQPHASSTPTPTSLSSLANTLNLPPSARRQLLGRSAKSAAGPNDGNITLTTFNTDAEYASNEALRAAGALETAAHNP